jgi:hypothetical protein
MKFNPYAMLVTTGALMLATVLIAQTGPSVALVKAGAVSVDRDVSKLAAQTVSSLQSSERRDLLGNDDRMSGGTRVASAEQPESVSED